MIFRRRLIITAAVICHVLLLPSIVTSQFLQPAPAGEGPVAEALPPAPARSRVPTEDVTIRARHQEKEGDVYRLRGEAEISYRNLVLRADEITYNADSGEATAAGNVSLNGGPHDEHIVASHGSYNVRAETGRFYDVVGSTGARIRGRSVILTSSNPLVFSGKIVEKLGPDKFVVHHGSITTCSETDPKWTFKAQRVEVVPGENAKIFHSSFHLFKVPVFYFPFVQHPVEKLGRQTGFLIPTMGQSSRKGTIIGDSFFWALNRSMDASVGAEYYSHRGFAQHGEFRARPTNESFITFRYFGVLDRNQGPGTPDQGGQEAHLNAEGVLPLRTRAVADINYLSSFVFRLAFAESFAQAINSEVRSLAFLSNSYRDLAINVMAARYQNFQSATRGDLITIVHAPGIEISSRERRIAGTRLHWSFDLAGEAVSRREPNFVTADLVGRFDLEPRISLPLVWRGWSLRPEVGLRNTYYTERLVSDGSGVGVPVPKAVNRRAFETAVELRPPALARIFDGELLGHTIKHAIEPRLVYRYVSGVDSFRSIIRFDARDILSDTSELEYALLHRIYAKRRDGGDCKAREPEAPTPDLSQPPWARAPRPESVAEPPCGPGYAREVISWELAQKYFFDPSFGGALVDGRRNVFTTTAQFTGIAFLTEPRRFSPIISRLRVRATNSADIEWHVDYDTRKGRVSSSTGFLNYAFGHFAVGGGHTFLHAPGEIIVSQPTPSPERFNQFRTLLRYGNPNKRGWSAGATIGFDANLQFLQYSAVQTTHNWDCCGLTFEYRRFALGVVRNENQFRFALTLANIGTFGTLKRQERLF
jgi:LPS-assembly protein